MSTLQVIDQDGDWYINIGAFRAVDPTSGHFFEPAVKYKILGTEWMAGQPTIELTSIEEDTSERQLNPKEPASPKVTKEPKEPKAPAA